MTKFTPLRDRHTQTAFKKGDIMVIFGEVFSRGYVNGLIDAAEKHGVKVIYSTVGRRDDNGKLRPLTDTEQSEKNQSPLINVPLEAGFDMDPAKNGTTPCDMLQGLGLTGWEDVKLDWKSIEESRQSGIERFRKYVGEYLHELEKHWAPGKNVFFAHTMAGGFPRAKVVMPIANKLFKGSGNRYLSSEMFWKTDIGRLMDTSFKEVTGQTFHYLIELSSAFRQKVEKSGGQVCYTAYGYHGNEIYIGNKLEWFSYSPYLQGWAKMHMEDRAAEWTGKGVHATVFNVPEILTSSSGLFMGLEIPLYELIHALTIHAPNHPLVQTVIEKCNAKLKDGFTYKDVTGIVQGYFANPEARKYPNFETWPQHNSPAQMERMKEVSGKILDLHKDPKDMLTVELSELIFKACGQVMFYEGLKPRASTLWIGHDLVAKTVTE